MRPPADAWVPWLYRAGMIVLSTASMAFLVWLIFIFSAIRGPLPLMIEAVRALAHIALGFVAILGVQQVGLVARNLVRNIKGSIGAASFEVESHDEPVARVITTTTTEVEK